MANKIVLVSDDTDFFDYIKSKLSLRKSDELFTFSFDDISSKKTLLSTAVLIVNSEGSEDKTLRLLKTFKDNPVVISAYNDNEEFKLKAYKLGMFDYITLLTTDKEFQARMIPALSVASVLEKSKQYRDILVRNNVTTPSNDVFLNYDFIIDRELERLENTKGKAVFMAISPNDKDKFLLKLGMIEAAILNNIRKNDILMTYASNKYFLIMFDIETKDAKLVWEKIRSELPQKIYAGISSITNQKRQQLINEVLNKLHEAINYDKTCVNEKSVPLSMIQSSTSACSNFKMFRQEFSKKLEQVIAPVFYQIQQKYTDKMPGISLTQGSGDGYGTFYIKGKYSSSCFRITSPGFSKINIDITFQKDTSNIDAKRITLDPEELEPGLLEDLLEQFISEYKKEVENDNT